MKTKTTKKAIRALGGSKVTPRPRATAPANEITRGAQVARTALKNAVERGDCYDKGYFLGLAHGYEMSDRIWRKVRRNAE